ncbi:SMI1/KNR4 family protein [Ferruginibacter sp. SUN106]|uniref:SMI1/KNR4 family protein n=1 Tax=Ferruginibacter sp. SUN106 TaxID=2978348 RepID=UPI003D36F876
MVPHILDIITQIEIEQARLGITLNPKATTEEIAHFEKAKNIQLPDDFRIFYSFCNGFDSTDFMFRIIPLYEIIGNIPDRHLIKQQDFHFAEYMVYSEMWTISIEAGYKNSYAIYNKMDNVVTLTNYLAEFLSVFITGGVFDGLYTWRERIERTIK